MTQSADNQRQSRFAWAPAILIMTVLFVASAQPKHPPPGDEQTLVYFSGMMPIFYGAWDLVIKKLAHLVVYGVLGVACLYALRRSGVALRQASYLAIVLATCYGISDELHQTFVTGRHASPFDVLIDFAGAGLFVLAARRYYPRIAAWLSRPR